MSIVNASENFININSPDNSRAILVRKRRKIDTGWKSNFMLQTIRNKAEKREVLVKCINRMRQSTQVKIGLQAQVKQFHSLTEKQLNVIDDFGSGHSKGTTTKQIKKQETQFESIYYESKLQMGKLRGLVLRYLEKHSKNQEWSIKPSHPFIIIWNMFKLFFMVHIFILFPLIDAFGVKLNQVIVRQEQIFLMEWIFLLFDIVLRFNVQIYKSGQLIKQHQYLALQYLKSGFFLDALGIVGFSLFLFQDILYIKYIYFFKISEIKKFIKFLRYELDPQNKYNNHIKLITLFVTIFLLAHIIACLWIVAGHTEPSWLSNHGLQDDQWYIQYLWAFYFAILTMTTVGYGDIVPVNEIELVACIMIGASFQCNICLYSKHHHDCSQRHRSEQELVQSGGQNHIKLLSKERFVIIFEISIEMGFGRNRSRMKIGYSPNQVGLCNKKSTYRIRVRCYLNYHSQLTILISSCIISLENLLIPKMEFTYCIKDKQKSVGSSQINPKYICDIFQGDHYGLLNLFNVDQSKYFLKSSGFSIFYFIPTQIFQQEVFCMINDQVIFENYSNLFLFLSTLQTRRSSHLAIAIAKSNKQSVQERQQYKRFCVKQQILRNYKEMHVETCQFINDKKEIMKIKYKSIFDSDDADEEPESIELQSSQSWQFDEAQMDEQKVPIYVDENQFKPKIPQQKRLTLNKRQTIVGFQKKKTQDIMQINLSNLQEAETFPNHHNHIPDNSSQKSKDTFDNIDVMKSFNKYFKKYNYQNIIKQLNQRRKTIKKKIKRLERIY
ncbi:unnamed protein product (macronuclear) [Paramecium tetraurelia]|uniref:Potassium channel domain-containing protein n=1 Tax=Paramecium tetraurelia TaxID=5888 RepID=A0C8H2_PARTE|nr:uncharacterized protein GSPATT00036222001 [Paramecium tetraurelia]CAK67089.1 unnamed protein product [Paramecium tetraurelia]|eukprot:XP_001434486.1 hypothetical protein (macronuclear) [Paramecium tetraurelia strain d4-2]